MQQETSCQVLLLLVSTGPEQVRQVRRWGADGASVGSALVKRMAMAGAGNIASEAELFCRELRDACD